MHELEVLLLVASRDMERRGEFSFLLLEASDGYLALPRAPLGVGETSLAVAARLLKEHLGFEARVGGLGWVGLVACPPADRLDRYPGCHATVTRGPCGGPVGLPFGCLVPASAARPLVAGARWVRLGELDWRRFLGDHLEVLTAVCNRL